MNSLGNDHLVIFRTITLNKDWVKMCVLGLKAVVVFGQSSSRASCVGNTQKEIGKS